MQNETLSINIFEININNIVGFKDFKNKNKNINLQKSIEAIGLQAPISVTEIANNKFQILDGNRRFAACKNLGHEKIRCIVHMF